MTPTTFSIPEINKCKIVGGIYAIKGLYNNFHLVGQTAGKMSKRWKKHISLARLGKHDNPYFQNSFSKHKESEFVFVLMEECDPISLNERETFWINKLKSMKGQFGWNMREGGAFGKYGSELRRRVSEGIRSSQKAMEEKHSRRKTYTLISPSNETTTFCGVKLFCDTNKIGRPNFYRLLNKKISHVKGWRLPEQTHKINGPADNRTSDLQRNCPECGKILEYNSTKTKISAEKKSCLCRKCSAHKFRDELRIKKYSQ